MRRKTRYVRVTVDLILHMPEESDTLPRGLSSVLDGTCNAVTKYMNRHFHQVKAPKADGFSDGHVKYSLYFPKKAKVRAKAKAIAA